MCGRISTADILPDDLRALFRLLTIPLYRQSYNLAPTLQIPAIREQHHIRSLTLLRWGLIPHWAKFREMDVSAFNARQETLTQKPFFRDSFKSKRCIIPASGFYEWQKRGERKQPYYIYRGDHQPIAIAGLWDVWEEEGTGERLESCTMITTPSTDQIAVIHERMPAILKPEFFDRWLDPEFKGTPLLQDVLRCRHEDRLKMYPVSNYVNNAVHDGEACIVPIAELDAL